MTDTIIVLQRQTAQKNAKGEWVKTVEPVEVYAKKQSVSSTEFFNASQIGLNPEIRFTMFKAEYQGETIIEYEGKRYSVYRTYDAGQDTVELYCQIEAGTA